MLSRVRASLIECVFHFALLFSVSLFQDSSIERNECKIYTRQRILFGFKCL